MTSVEPVAARAAPLGRRRPSGEPPPLPRPVSTTTRAYVALGVLAVGLWAALLTPSLLRAVTIADVAVLDALAGLRTDAVTTVMRDVHGLGSQWAFRLVFWPTVLTLLAFRRFQRLLALLAVILVVVAVDGAANVVIGRMRPPSPEILAGWTGYAHPSMPVATLGLATVGALYSLVPAGRWRNRAAWLVGIPVGSLAAARLYLAVDHPTDVVAALVTGVAVPAAAFRLLTPDEAFPVTYHPGQRAHLDVGGRRGEAIVAALRTQLGLRVIGIEPFALSGSAGSTPLRLQVAGGDGGESLLFGKLYATSHLRSDRWYKLARTVMYGRLEDERSFNAVRRLVEYEDHMLRLAADAGLPTARPLGVVEITPEREYLVVTEFIERSVPVSEADVDGDVIDSALAVVRRMWAAGLAHRDIKPGNLLVRDGEVVLIDLAFAAVRPSPWRQAVDLSNMMLTLALRSTPERVYDRALRQFSADEIAEAFAASRSVTIPAQLRALLRADGRGLVQRFRALAPARPPVAIQRWSLRRAGLTLGVLAGTLVAIGTLVANLRLAGLL